MKLTNLYLDEKLRSQIKKYCDRTGATMSGTIRTAIKKFVDDKNE